MILILFIISQILVSKRNLYLNERRFFINFLMFFFPLILSPFLIPPTIKILNRMGAIGDDASALARLISFKFGIDIFSQNVILGVGYNYLSLFTEKFNDMTSIDSSLLSLLINFGIVLSTIIILATFYFFRKIWSNTKFYRAGDIHLQNFLSQFFFYVILVVIFASQFNNLIFYQFWLFPIIIISTYFWNFIPRDLFNGHYHNRH